MAINPPKEFSTRMSKGKSKVYKRVEGQLNGEDRYVRYLHAIGRKVSQMLAHGDDIMTATVSTEWRGPCSELGLHKVWQEVQRPLPHAQPSEAYLTPSE
jgi:hypothetical protein